MILIAVPPSPPPKIEVLHLKSFVRNHNSHGIAVLSKAVWKRIRRSLSCFRVVSYSLSLTRYLPSTWWLETPSKVTRSPSPFAAATSSPDSNYKFLCKWHQ